MTAFLAHTGPAGGRGAAMTCSVPGCDRNPAYASGGRSGTCHAHYWRFLVHGDTFPHIPIGAAKGRHGLGGRWPLAPLLAHLHGLSARQAADRPGCSSRTIVRWRNGHTAALSLADADRYATRLGRHIDDIWPEEAIAS